VRRGGCIGSWWGNWREGNHWGDLGVDVWIILGWVSRRWDVGIWTELGWPRIETSMGDERGVYRVLVGKLEGRKPLGRPRRRCVDNIRMGLEKVGCGYMDWIGLAQDRDRWRTLLSALMNLRVP